MQALKLGDNISLVFVKVLDEMRLGLVGEDEDGQEVTDREYWEKHGSKGTVGMADELLEILRSLDSTLALKYNKFYVGLVRDGQPDNFVIFRPKKDWLRLEARLESSEELQAQLEEAGLDVMEYDPRWQRYRIRLAKGDVKKHEAFLKKLLKTAYDAANS